MFQEIHMPTGENSVVRAAAKVLRKLVTVGKVPDGILFLMLRVRRCAPVEALSFSMARINGDEEHGDAAKGQRKCLTSTECR